MKKIILASLIFSFLFMQLYAQSGAQQPTKRPQDWWKADWQKDSLPGISLDEAYNYLKGRKSKTVIVAIIDDCIDTSHEDLKNILWTNKKEIAGNGIDDDKNGYVDDVHGWCFVCGKNGVSQNEEYDLPLLTYRAWKKQFENTDASSLTGSLKIQYDMYQLAKKYVFDTYRYYQLGRTMQSDTIKFIQYLDNLSGRYKDTALNHIPFATLPFSNAYDSAANIFWSIFLKEKLNANPPTLAIWTSILKMPDMLNGQFFGNAAGLNESKYDTTKNFRLVIGDDDNNFTDVYGTGSIKPQDHSDHHATFIAGIIAANRKNNVGIKGIADNILLMPIIVGKNGPTRDKDIVFAIHYAVDNGASVINLSIGGVPEIADHEKELREAFDYANTHGVLIVNAAGNDAANLDNEKYLMGQGPKGTEHDTYIRVGATTSLLNDNLLSTFSNYGKNKLDLFAPGTAIYSTVPGNKYDYDNGTSFSCPIVVGVAALLKSYFPTLTAKQVKEILMKSVFKPDVIVIPPSNSGIKTKMPFSQMSKSGGIVNAYNAVKLADEIVKKKK